MPSVTLKRPLMLISWDCRHRLGFTVSGAFDPSVMKAYFCGFQMVFPDWPLMISAGNGAISPLRALSKSDVSENGNCWKIASFAFRVAWVASLRWSWATAKPRSTVVLAEPARASVRARDLDCMPFILAFTPRRRHRHREVTAP
jgi:hypothetical protein